MHPLFPEASVQEQNIRAEDPHVIEIRHAINIGDCLEEILGIARGTAAVQAVMIVAA